VAQRTSQKLASKFYGLYLILKKVGLVASKLLLPTSTSIHQVFHVSQLKKHIGNRVMQATLPNIPPASKVIPWAILDKKDGEEG
jgi:hypothetical protein